MPNEIVKIEEKLPVKLEDLAKWIIIGKQVLVSKIAKYKAIKTAEASFEARQIVLGETQDFAEELLYAEAYLGERLKGLANTTASRAGRRQLPENINHKQSHYAQELNRHIDLIAKVVNKARETDEIALRHDVLREIQKAKPKPEIPPLPKDIYNVIYADPPWNYGDKLIEGYGAAEHHYPALTIQTLCELPVIDILADNAVLYMWVTSPLLDECWPVIEAWGFEYKTSFVWDKVKHNYGHYNSVRHEMLLICTRGSFLPQSKKLYDSVQSIERTSKHSEKPEQFRKIIEKMYPKGKRIELFARKKIQGWDVYGDEC